VAFAAPERGLCANGLNAHLNVSVWGVTHRSAGVAMLYKWFVVGLSEYELIIFADLDVTLLRPEQPADAVRARWQSQWSHLSRDATGATTTGTVVLGDRDPLAAFNAGLWTIARPSTELYEEGLRQMHRVSFNRTHGFGLLGRPKAVAGARPQLKATLPGLQRSRTFKLNEWGSPRIPFSDCDQGFFAFMFFLHRGGIGGRMGPVNASGKACHLNVTTGKYLRAQPADCAHLARHRYGTTKPWRLLRGHQNKGEVANYLSGIRHAHLANSSACAAQFSAWLPSLPPALPLGTHLKHQGRYQRVGP